MEVSVLSGCFTFGMKRYAICQRPQLLRTLWERAGFWGCNLQSWAILPPLGIPPHPILLLFLVKGRVLDSGYFRIRPSLKQKLESLQRKGSLLSPGEGLIMGRPRLLTFPIGEGTKLWSWSWSLRNGCWIIHRRLPVLHICKLAYHSAPTITRIPHQRSGLISFLLDMLPLGIPARVLFLRDWLCFSHG